MAIKRILFPALALLIPGSVVGWLYWSTEQKLHTLYHETLAGARKMGLPATADEFRKALPSDAENAATPLLEVGKDFDWPALRRMTPVLPGSFLAKTNDLQAALITAAARSKIALPLDPIDSAFARSETILQVLHACVDRATAYSNHGDRQEAIDTIVMVAKLRDMLLQATPPSLAMDGESLDFKILQVGLGISGRFGTPAVTAIRPIILQKEILYDSVKTGFGLAGYQLAYIDYWVEKSKQDVLGLSMFKDDEHVMALKVKIVQSTITYVYSSKQRKANDIFASLNDMRYEVSNRLPPPLASKLSFLYGNPPPPHPLPDDLVPWYWKACEAGGKKPADLQGVLDVHRNPIQFKPLKDGFMIFGCGRNGIDEGGKGDDRWMKYERGYFSSRG